MNPCTLLLVVAAAAASDAVGGAKALSTADTQLRAKLISAVDDVVAGHIPDEVSNRVGDVEAILTPTFKSMKKNAKGYIDYDESYYVLQRFFSQQHGWTFAAFGQGSIELVNEKFRSYREGGFALNDVALIAATIEHIVNRSDLADTFMVGRHNEDCMSKEGMLFDMELGQSGRVPLSDFFHIAINEPSYLIPDSMHMLRANGALDEADASNPKIIIPNYMASPSNCISHSSLFSICCPDGCLQLLSHIEAAVGKDDASAEEVVSVIENAPVQLTGLSDGFVPLQLVRKLRDMTSFNGGRVPLHGEAFAQWLHVVTPQTCVLPQGGTTIPSKEALHVDHGSANGKMAIEEDLFVTRTVAGSESAENLVAGGVPSKNVPLYVIGTMTVFGLIATATRRVVSPRKEA